MFESINHSRNAVFKKKHYTRIIKQTAKYCTHLFGYTKGPIIVESSYDPTFLMSMNYLSKRHSYLVHNYNNFRKVYGKEDFTCQAAWTMFLTAHEMRHFYQHRQLDSKNPVEDENILNEWRINYKQFEPNTDFTLLSYFLQPVELDAEMFAYIFVAEHMEVLLSLDAIDDQFIHHLEEYFVRYYGETNERLFPKENVQ